MLGNRYIGIWITGSLHTNFKVDNSTRYFYLLKDSIRFYLVFLLR